MTEVILFVSGAVIGSFLNVVGLRFNSGLTLLGRSSCPRCAHGLRWWELIPILSFFFLRGRCSKCSAKISIQYPLIEIWTGILFATLPYLFIPIFCIYVVIVIYDFRHKIIPDSLSYVALGLAILVKWQADFMGGLVAAAALFGFFALIWLVSRGRAMGFGDAKLALSVGMLLGIAEGVSAIILAFWIGAVVGIILLFSMRKQIRMKSEIPFAPFIILGAWLAAAFHLNIFHVPF